ncbi:MAG: hypothetical protein H7145_02130 [Akkermansiaceae bacterium]|nr:hypothetical protein [Armatimonadota bacterium]
MASMTSKKLPQPWHTKSFHLARFWVIMSFVCYLTVESLLKGKFPSLMGGSLIYFFLEWVSIASWDEKKPDLRPLLLDGSTESQAQLGNLRWSTLGMGGMFILGLLTAYLLIGVRHEHLLLSMILFTRINISGWFLMRWMTEAFAIMNRYKIGNVSESTNIFAPSIASTPVISQPVPQTHSQGLLAGSGIRP